jgi:hypothetical protein
VQNLVGPVGFAVGLVPGEAGQETGVPSELRRDPVIRVAPDRERQDDHPRPEVAELRHHDPAHLVGILQVGVRQAGIAPFVNAHHGGGALGLLLPECGAAA